MPEPAEAVPTSAAAGIEVYSYDPGERVEWNSLAARARQAHFLFDRSYMEYHADRFTDASLLVRDGGRLVAIFPASRHGDEVVSHGGLTFGGLVSTGELTTRRTLIALEEVLRHYRARGVRALIYKAVPHIYHHAPAEEDLYALFRLNATLVRREISSAVRPDRRIAYRKGRRASIRESLRAGVQVAESRAFGQFMELLADALRRKHGLDPVHTPEEIELLANRFPEAIRLFTANLGGAIEAGIIVYETSMVAHTQYIGATERGRKTHASDVILDHLIAERYSDKAYFDFGISTEQDGRVLNEGLVRNKESYGARAIAYDTYRVDLDRRPAVR